jgi:hypothetical protein
MSICYIPFIFSQPVKIIFDVPPKINASQFITDKTPVSLSVISKDGTQLRMKEVIWYVKNKKVEVDRNIKTAYLNSKLKSSPRGITYKIYAVVILNNKKLKTKVKKIRVYREKERKNDAGIYYFP